MITLNLVKITDTSGKTTGVKDGVSYQALDDDELDDIYASESSYSYIGRNFKVDRLGDITIYNENIVWKEEVDVK